MCVWGRGVGCIFIYLIVHLFIPIACNLTITVKKISPKILILTNVGWGVCVGTGVGGIFYLFNRSFIYSNCMRFDYYCAKISQKMHLESTVQISRQFWG